MTTTALPDVPVLSPGELTLRWSALLLEPPSFGFRSLWLAWMGADGVMLPVLNAIDHLRDHPDRTFCDGVLGLHEIVVGSQGRGPLHLATALSRPGGPSVTGDDVVWAEELRTGLGARLDGSWSLHLAAAGKVTPMIDPPVWAWR